MSDSDYYPKKKTPLRRIIDVAAVIAIIAIFYFVDPFGLFEYTDANPSQNEDSVRIPILMYHHFADYGNVGTVVSENLFSRQLIALREAGFNTISFEQLRAFVYDDYDLPENPLIISIDDGYLSVYEVAWPLLVKNEMVATTFIIGVTHGMDTYKDTGFPIIPRFNDEQAQAMVASGFMYIDSHSYDMHQHEPFEQGPFRRGVLQRADESEEEYIAAFREDFARSAAQIYEMLGHRSIVFSYPFGLSNNLTDDLLREMGVYITLKITPGVNTVTRGDSDSLMSMHRLNVPGDMSPEQLIAMINRHM